MQGIFTSNAIERIEISRAMQPPPTIVLIKER